MPHHRGRLEIEFIEQVVVEEDKVPHIVERLVGVLVARREAGMLRRIDCEVLRQFVDEFGFDWAVAAVQINQRRASALNFYLRMDLVAPDAQLLFLARHLVPSGKFRWSRNAARRTGRPQDSQFSELRPVSAPLPCALRRCRRFSCAVHASPLATTCSPSRLPKHRGSKAAPRSKKG